MSSDYLTTAEVAELLRLNERSVYELVRKQRIPCSRVAGKWLFPRQLVHAWVLAGVAPEHAPAAATPPVVAGSHDPLLAWAVDAAAAGLSMQAGGSLDGLRRIAAGEAMLCALHLPDPAGEGYNREAVRALASPPDLLLLRFAQRRQGLITAAGNPKGIRQIGDLSRAGVRVVQRQADAGSRALLDRLLANAGILPRGLQYLPEPARSEEALALAVLDGSADVGLGIEAAAGRFALDFVPLHVERLDLALRRHDYFEPPLQALLAVMRGSAFAEKARQLGGYAIEGLGEVVYNR